MPYSIYINQNKILINRYIPFFKTLKSYSWSTFFSDLPAGVLVAILLVPQAIAYAYLAGMPPQYGLYAALVPILIYAFLGTSPHLAIGPVAISSLLILAGISKLAEPFSPRYIELTILAGLMIGFVQLIIGILKLGKYVNLLSFPVITGFTSAASVIVITSQIKDVLGIDTPRFEFLPQTIIHTIQHILQTHLLTFAIAIGCFLIIFLLRRVNRKIPGGLIVVGIGIIISNFFNLSDKGVDVIGFVPAGLPSFELPSTLLLNIIPLIPTVVLVTIIGIIESVAIAKAIENKNQYYEIRTNKELVALGVSKIGGSFFGALPSSGSFSRSALLNEANGKTTIASIITVGFVAVSLLFLTPLLFYLPKVILAIIIMYAVKNLFEFQLAKTLIKMHRYDFMIMLITFLVTTLISIEIGVAIGFIFSLFNLHSLKHALPKSIFKILTQNYDKDIYFEKDQQDASNAILTIEENLHFGNAHFLKDTIKYKLVNEPTITTLIIHFNDNVDIDSSAIKSLEEILRLLKAKNIKPNIHGLNQKITQRLKISQINLPQFNSTTK